MTQFDIGPFYYPSAKLSTRVLSLVHLLGVRTEKKLKIFLYYGENASCMEWRLQRLAVLQ